MINLKNNSLNLSEQTIIGIILYLVSFNIKKIQDIKTDTTKIDNVRKLYAYLLEYEFNRMYNNDLLIMEYSSEIEDRLDYIEGIINIPETLASGSLIHGELVQTIGDKSYDTELNNIIDYCLRYSAKIIGLDEIKPETKVHYESVFGTNLTDRLDKREKTISKLVNALSEYSTTFYFDYIDYQGIIELCKLMLEELYYSINESNPDEHMIDDKSIRHLMEEFTRVVCRNVIGRVNTRLGIKASVVKDDELTICHDEIYTNLRLDILIKSNDNTRNDIIIDVKTNEGIISKNHKYNIGDNLTQIYTYHGMYKELYKDNIACLFHYISNNDAEAIEYFKKPIWEENRKKDNLKVYVYLIDNETFSTSNVEAFIEDKLTELLSKSI